MLLQFYDQFINGFDNEIYVKDKNGVYIAANEYYVKKLVKMGVLSNLDDSIIGLSDHDFFTL